MRKPLLALALPVAAFAVLAGGCSSSTQNATDVASSAMGKASSAAAAASSAVAQATAGACDGINQVKDSITTQTSPTATAGEVRTAAQSAQTQLDTVAADAGPVKGAVVSAMQAAETAVINNLQGVPDSTPLNQAPAAAQAAVQGLNTAYSAMSSAFGC